jgi:alkylated DNA repair dioxygenase AlkB
MGERKRLRRLAELPAGFSYRPNFLSEEEERQLLSQLRQLPFESALYRGFTAKRRIVAFGVLYSFETNELSPGPPVPEFLCSLRSRLGELAMDRAPEAFVEALATEYSPGATIGWHRDAPQFGGTVIGVSLAASCRMRLRLEAEDEYLITSLELAPRSAYVMQGEARWRWQHSIPAVAAERYSITFRTLRSGEKTKAGPQAA